MAPILNQDSPKASRAWQRFKQNRPAVISAAFLVLLAAVVVAWPACISIAGRLSHAGQAFARAHDPVRVSDAQFSPPDRVHWFGTDVHGRDLFARVIYGTRISLLVGLTGAAVSLLIGVAWGATAGYIGGRLDSFMMRTVDVLYSMPSIILVIVLITAFENVCKAWLATAAPELTRLTRLLLLVIGLGSVSWLTMARIVRGQVLALRNQPFVEAARALGAGTTRILTKHIIPNTAGVVIVYLTLTVPSVVLYESFLSYLGLGIQPPLASLGSLIAEGAAQINPIRIYWWLIVFPGAVLVAMLMALNFLGDGLRDAFDVKATK
ncbi:MAG: ABC transporter permease [Verrucomicrobiae bacterium]|nr:ABC transporter permease [Verrucomicrobiae bacterium]MDW7980479.1 ABC transporter permease [Verrucomicrobiales bacterium]